VELHLTPDSFHDESGLVFIEEGGLRGFYKRRIKPRLNKGFVSNLITFIIMILGLIIVKIWRDSIIGQFILSFGLFGFSGGFTNWLAIKMLFDKIPFLYGSGVIPRRFKEIRETVKNVIMKTFFDEVYLENYLKQKAGQLSQSVNFADQLNKILASPEVEAVIEKKLAELGTRPEGAMFAMMGINPVMLKPIIMPFVIGMGTELFQLFGKNFDPTQFISIGRIRAELDDLMTTKLEELTPNRVKKLIEDVIEEHLGWLIIWGNVFGGLIGIVTQSIEMFT